jgi:IclR family transcriptional regulator, pca regulon regulatory protein
MGEMTTAAKRATKRATKKTKASLGARTQAVAAQVPGHLAGPERSGDVNFMASLARGLAVIRAFSEQGRRYTIADVSRTVGFPRAAVRRCLYTLEQLGYVGSDEQGFFLRPKILALGYAYLSSDRLASSAQPLLERVCALVQEACSLATLDGDEIVYVARATTGKRIMSIDISVGTRFPAYCTSMGRVLLAHLPPVELAAFLERAELRTLTDRTVGSREKLEHILTGVRSSDHCIVDQELELGLRSIAVPVRDSTGRVLAAINVGTQAARFGLREMESKLLPPLRSAAQELTAMLP